MKPGAASPATGPRGAGQVELAIFVLPFWLAASPSPSPWPSPAGRGDTASRAATSRDALDWRKRGARFALSRRERAGVRGTSWLRPVIVTPSHTTLVPRRFFLADHDEGVGHRPFVAIAWAVHHPPAHPKRGGAAAVQRHGLLASEFDKIIRQLRQRHADGKTRLPAIHFDQEKVGLVPAEGRAGMALVPGTLVIRRLAHPRRRSASRHRFAVADQIRPASDGGARAF